MNGSQLKQFSDDFNTVKTYAELSLLGLEGAAEGFNNLLTKKKLSSFDIWFNLGQIGLGGIVCAVGGQLALENAAQLLQDVAETTAPAPEPVPLRQSLNIRVAPVKYNGVIGFPFKTSTLRRPPLNWNL